MNSNSSSDHEEESEANMLQTGNRLEGSKIETTDPSETEVFEMHRDLESTF